MPSKFNRTYTCTCTHAGHWHRPNCRIPGCTCTEFQHATIDALERHLGSWPQAHARRRRILGHGPDG